MELLPANPFTVSFDETFYANLLKSPGQLSLLPRANGEWRIAVLKDRAVEPPKNWEEIVARVLVLFEEAEKAGIDTAAEYHVAQIEKPFVEITFAANIHALHRSIYPSEAEEDAMELDSVSFAVEEMGFKKRPLPQEASARKKRRLEGPSLPEREILYKKMIALMLAIRELAITTIMNKKIHDSTFQITKKEMQVRMMHRRDYLEVIPADFVFIVGEEKKEIRAHRAILQSYPSSILSKPFEHSLKESQENAMLVEEVDTDVFELLVDFLYHKQVELPVIDRNLPDVGLEQEFIRCAHHFSRILELAERYRIEELVAYCRSKLARAGELLTQWNRHKIAEPTSAKGAFAELIEPLLHVGYTNPAFKSLVTEQEEKIDLIDSSSGAKVTFSGIRVLLAGRDLTFRKWLTEMDGCAHPLPPASVLQALSVLIRGNRENISDFKITESLIEDGWRCPSRIAFVFLVQCILNDSPDIDRDLEQFSQFLEVSFFSEEWLKQGWWIDDLIGALRSDDEKTVWSKLAAALRHFGSHVSLFCASIVDGALNNGTEVEHLVELLAQHCPSLQALTCEGTDADQLTDNLCLNPILEGFKQLRELKISNFQLYVREVEKTKEGALAATVPLHSLKKLNLALCLSSSEVISLLSQYATEVTTFFFDLGIVEGGDDPFLDLIRSMKKLERCPLYLLPTATLKKMIDLGMTFPYFRKHSEWGNYENSTRALSDEMLLQLFSRSRCPELEALELFDGQPNGEAYIQIKEETVLALLDQHPQLKKLDIFYVASVTDRLVLSIGDKCPELEKLRIRGTITSDAVETMLAKLPRLRRLFVGLEIEGKLKDKYPQIKWGLF